jgi:hypothetical protein
MRKLLLLFSLSLVMLLVFAATAGAQEGSPVGGDETNTPCGRYYLSYIPEVNGCFIDEGQVNPTLDVTNNPIYDADTGEKLGLFKDVVDLSAYFGSWQGPYATEFYCTSGLLGDDYEFSQDVAQAYYDGVPNASRFVTGTANAQERELMDPNGDGLACTPEDFSLTAGDMPDKEVPEEAPTTQYADNDDDDIASTPDTGGPSLGATGSLLGGVALLAGGLLLRRRLS